MSSLLDGIQFVSEDSSKRSKKSKKKKKRKKKKSKKKKRSRRRSEDDSGSSSSSEEETTTTTSSTSRMDWMNKPSNDVGHNLFERKDRQINGIVSKPGATRANIYTDKGIVGKYARKLGEGLRNVERQQASLSAQSKSAEKKIESVSRVSPQQPRSLPQQTRPPQQQPQRPPPQQQPRRPPPQKQVSNVDLQWKRKSMKRAKEQAERENRSLRDVLIDRVGVAEAEILLSNKELLSALRGVVVSWNSERGFGFIRPSSSSSKGEDLFCHTRSITSGQKELSKGTVVEYETRRNSRSGKTEACDVRVVIDTSVNERKQKKRKKMAPPDAETKQREASRASFLYGGGSSKTDSKSSSRPPLSPPLKKAKKAAISLDSLSSLSKNELAARALRARMSGNMEECQKIEEMLQNMQETVIVTPLDERGRMISELTTKTMTKDNNSAASQLRMMLREEKQESTRSHDLSFIKTYVSLTSILTHRIN